MPGYTGFSNPPACVDCEHSWRGIGRPTYTRCARPTGERFDRVSGLLIDTVDRPARAERSRDRGLFSRALRCGPRSEEHTSELQSLMRISYAVFCLKKKNKNNRNKNILITNTICTIQYNRHVTEICI